MFQIPKFIRVMIITLSFILTLVSFQSTFGVLCSVATGSKTIFTSSENPEVILKNFLKKTYPNVTAEEIISTLSHEGLFFDSKADPATVKELASYFGKENISIPEYQLTLKQKIFGIKDVAEVIESNIRYYSTNLSESRLEETIIYLYYWLKKGQRAKGWAPSYLKIMSEYLHVRPNVYPHLFNPLKPNTKKVSYSIKNNQLFEYATWAREYTGSSPRTAELLHSVVFSH